MDISYKKLSELLYSKIKRFRFEELLLTKLIKIKMRKFISVKRFTLRPTAHCSEGC